MPARGKPNPPLRSGFASPAGGVEVVEKLGISGYFG